MTTLLTILCSEMKGVQEKESIMGVRGRQKNPSLAITVWHHPARLVMPNSDPRDGFFYLPLTPMTGPCILMRAEIYGFKNNLNIKAAAT